MILGAIETDPVELSALEFDVLWEHYHGVDQMPLVLKVPSPGKTDEERERIVASVWDGLARRGLGTPVDPYPPLTRLLDLLRRPDREIDGRLWVDGELRILVAATGDEAVLATLSGGQLRLLPAEATGLPRYALSVLPPTPAGPGQSITLPTADFVAAAGEATKQEELAAVLAARGVRDTDAKTLAEMIGDIVSRGQFGCAVRDKWGRRVRADRVISFFDTADGRYLQVRRVEENAAAWTTISPANPRRMLQHLTDLHDEQLALRPTP
ncbi:ESX secretion-associated protein EspG [Actinophytocola oryzae]|uniref:ESAT-6 protein secretion system EspG family protein n=1 Tax=Actinophytocola oryzae TaxID=502181 RepID=A0A4R7V251_9PSEU|nr:ESX secretion-associated protein EspG [Actinophytocola oryzae]TDV41506.1 ESAT-6 protein secretion system EspG family protein [Actinophytocola oryzae]